MVIGATLTIATLSLLVSALAILVAVGAVGQQRKLAARVDALEVTVAALQGHRLRLDANVMVLAQHSGLLAKVNGVPLAPEPARPQ